ncbi:wd g-beta repeat-containing protein [Cystoisospora suis]|uniref:Wd g-beta repeat-containing protein n=1 Tax=Cystoisospora suis TaxID=483139 RepID=A0A2C6KJK3_9APIC|nr:wd g-beta repeat-containing protein [Cystoisospora suis]
MRSMHSVKPLVSSDGSALVRSHSKPQDTLPDCSLPPEGTAEPSQRIGPDSSPLCRRDVKVHQETEGQIGPFSQEPAAATDAPSTRSAEAFNPDQGATAVRPEYIGEEDNASPSSGSLAHQDKNGSQNAFSRREICNIVSDSHLRQQVNMGLHTSVPSGSERLACQHVDAPNVVRGLSSPLKGEQATAASEPVYLRSYSFNQDNSCFVCATTAGFRVFTCAPLFEFARRELPSWGEGAYEVAGMLFRTNVFALVSQGDSKKVKLWDDQKNRFIGELRSRQAVKNVCLGREILAMVTEYTIYTYQSEQMRPFSIIHTGANPRGLCIVAAGRGREQWILACPAVAAGAVRIQTSEGERSSHVFQAHQSPLAALSFSSEGTWIATASETGTVIRIFSTSDGQLLHELRRGTHSYAISCIALRADGLFLAVASSSPTVHVFKLDHREAPAQPQRPRGGTRPATEEAAETRSSLKQERSGESCKSQSPLEVFSDNGNSPGRQSTTPPPSEDAYRPVSSGVPLQQALSVGKELTSVVYDASKEMVHDAIKGVLPRYFSAVRSFAQFHVPTDQQSIDVRAPGARIAGPLCAFAGERSNHLYLLHPNGVFYEFRFDPNYGDECTLLTATTWFAPRPDFQIQSHFGSASLPSELEGGHAGDDWQIVM